MAGPLGRSDADSGLESFGIVISDFRTCTIFTSILISSSKVADRLVSTQDQLTPSLQNSDFNEYDSQA